MAARRQRLQSLEEVVAAPSANLPWTRQPILDIPSRLAALKFFLTRSHP
jgi:hypothetical protein